MKIETTQTINVTLHLTEKEAQVISAGLYALQMSDPLSMQEAVWNFGTVNAAVIDSLQTAFGESGLWPRPVCDAFESIALWPRQDCGPQLSSCNPERRGLPGITNYGEEVLQQLLTLAWKHPDRWVSAACYRPSRIEKDEVWLKEIHFLVGLGRITPQVIGGQEGWVVPSADEWRAFVRNRARQTV